MPHTLTIGMTESGKTTLEQSIAQAQMAKGINVIVLDPFLDEKWNTPYLFNDPNKFLVTVFSSQNCEIFVDESGDAIGRYGGVMQKLATRSRHLGHNAHFICQRASQLDKTIRDQCSYLNLFCVSTDDAKTLSSEYKNGEMLKRANELNRGEFFRISKFGPCEKFKLWNNG